MEYTIYSVYLLASYSSNIHKSAGLNKIHTIVLKDIREVTAPIFSARMVLSVPKDCKQANVVPVYKKGMANITQTTDQFLLPALYQNYLKRSLVLT